MHVVPVKLLYIRPLYHILLQGKKENKKNHPVAHLLYECASKEEAVSI